MLCLYADFLFDLTLKQYTGSENLKYLQILKLPGDIFGNDTFYPDRPAANLDE